MDEVHAGLFQLNHDHDALDPKTRAEIPYADGARNCRSAALCHDGSLRSGLWRGRTRAGSPVFSSFQRCDPQRTSNGRGPALLLLRLRLRPGPRTFWNLCFPATARWRAVKGTGSFHGAHCFPWLADRLVCGYGAVAAHDSLSNLGAGLFNNGSYWVPHRIARSGGGTFVRFFARAGLPGNCGCDLSKTISLSAQHPRSCSCTALRACCLRARREPESYPLSPCDSAGVARARGSAWSVLEHGFWGRHSIGGPF